MPRKGLKRVHTGCKTCKIRRVKCDETKPTCRRCTSTGRKCDGYAEPKSAIQLYHIQPSQVPWANPTEIRNLEFFRKFVAPMLAGPSPSFWIDLVPQMTHHEPIARHALMATSSFFEQSGGSSRSATSDLRFAMRQYHHAIKQMIEARPDNLDIVVTACVLLIPVELWRGDPRAAMFHFTHARRIMDTYTPSVELERVLGYLNYFVLVFSDFFPIFPRPRLLECAVGVGSFCTAEQAKEVLEVLTGRCVGLGFARQLEGHPEDVIRLQQKSLNEDLDAWFARLYSLERLGETFVKRGFHLLEVRLFEARWLVCKIWANDGMRPDAPYGDREHHFRRIVWLALEAESGAPKFTFSMEFAVLLHCVIRKCRDEKIQFDAVVLFERAFCARANLEFQLLSCA